MRSKGDRSVLTKREIAWAWKKLREGHAIGQVADALNRSRSTITRANVRVYGKTKPGTDEMLPLVYKEGRDDQ